MSEHVLFHPPPPELSERLRDAAMRDPALDPRTDHERVYAIKTTMRLRRERRQRKLGWHP